MLVINCGDWEGRLSVHQKCRLHWQHTRFLDGDIIMRASMIALCGTQKSSLRYELLDNADALKQVDHIGKRLASRQCKSTALALQERRYLTPFKMDDTHSIIDTWIPKLYFSTSHITKVLFKYWHEVGLRPHTWHPCWIDAYHLVLLDTAMNTHTRNKPFCPRCVDSIPATDAAPMLESNSEKH
uniref:AlNc14C313G10510 protein n=1 Tax=Albugo laibachii Nc14 TaxID=890382 RepID=F0WW68_9STRA|nr:AlNc14C313G10510 [Albugo laibachii Nc14]|eukprot:CCA25687.1 AlNc14C313G10510 [Albugo laibachii Nc14]